MIYWDNFKQLINFIDNNENDNLLYTLTFQVTKDCNCQCDYCYENNKEQVYMDLTTGKKCIDFFFNNFLNSNIKVIGLNFIGGEPLLNLYIDNPLDISYGLQRLRIILLTYFLCGLMDVFALSLRGIGYSFVPTIVSLLGVCGIRLLWIFLIFPLEEFHNLGSLVVSYPISWFITALIQFILLITLKKKVFNRMNNSIQIN